MRTDPTDETAASNVLAAVLAAGPSSRLGRPKQLLPWRGTTLVRATAETGLASRCHRVAVITGAHDGEVRAALDGLPLDVIFNAGWAEGMASSLRCAVSRAVADARSALVVMVCDQPGLTSDHLDALLAVHLRGAPVAASRYRGRLGVPVLFGQSSFAALLELRGAEGAQRLLGAAPQTAAVDWEDGAFDVDTAADVERLSEPVWWR